MRITIEDIRHPLQMERISNTSKFIVIYDEGRRPIKILVGTTYRTFRNGNFNQQVETEMIHTPSKNIYEADLAISTDIIVSKFSVIKNRYSPISLSNVKPLLFLNQHLDELVKPLLNNPTIYDVMCVKAEIIRAFSLITGESFHFVGGKWMTMRDLFIQNNLIKYKTLKHKFVNARVS